MSNIFDEKHVKKMAERVRRDTLIRNAAPDLYEALEKMCKWHELQATWDKGDNGYYAAKKALAKARGEA